MAITSVAAVYALYAIDDIKNRDTILYAKFLANLKDKWSRGELLLKLSIKNEFVYTPPDADT